MSRRSQYLVFFTLTALFGVSVVKLFGTTVSSKFNNANSYVASDVTFGGPYDAPLRSVAREVPQISTAQRETAAESTSTFSIDVDTGSYTQARRSLEGGWAPAPQTVRVEEFVNYFPYSYARPPADRTATVQFEGAPSPFSEDGDTHLLRIGLRAASLAQPVPAHVTFLVDTSGSMAGSDRLPLAKEAMKQVVRSLRKSDRVAIATYAGSTRLVLDSTPAAQTNDIFDAIDDLESGGGTAMGSGMELAYEVAARHAGPGRVSRVFVLSDGDANIGARRSVDILDAVRSEVAEGVTLSTVGFGTGNYNDAMMEQLADAGNGNYTYIDSADEIPLVFGDRLASLLHVVAKDVKVQVEFDTDAVKSWRQVGYDNRQLEHHEFRDDRVDAGEMGADHQVTALYEVVLHPGVRPEAPIARVRFRHKAPHGTVSTEAESVMLGSALRGSIGETSADFRFQAAVATFAERLRGTAHQSFGWIEEVASSAVAGRPERQRFVDLVRTAARIDERG